MLDLIIGIMGLSILYLFVKISRNSYAKRKEVLKIPNYIIISEDDKYFIIDRKKFDKLNRPKVIEKSFNTYNDARSELLMISNEY